jgi:hypothetical protein
VQQDPETKKETAMTLTVSYVLEGEIGTEKPLLITRSRAPYVASRKREAVVMPPEA